MATPSQMWTWVFLKSVAICTYSHTYPLAIPDRLGRDYNNFRLSSLFGRSLLYFNSLFTHCACELTMGAQTSCVESFECCADPKDTNEGFHYRGNKTAIKQRQGSQSVDNNALIKSLDHTIFKKESAVCTDSDYTKCAGINRFRDLDSEWVKWKCILN